jgi:hypothetical protein
MCIKDYETEIEVLMVHYLFFQVSKQHIVGLILRDVLLILTIGN